MISLTCLRKEHRNERSCLWCGVGGSGAGGGGLGPDARGPASSSHAETGARAPLRHSRAAQPAATPPPAPRPFPEGAKIAYVVLQRVANESAEGKTASTRIQALQQRRRAELNEKNKQLQALQAASSRRKPR